MDEVVKEGGISNGDCGMALNERSPIALLVCESVEVVGEGTRILFGSSRKGACDAHESEWDSRVCGCEGDSLCAQNGQIGIANRVVEKYDLGGEDPDCSSVQVGQIVGHGVP